MAKMDTFLTGKKITREHLNKPVKPEHRNEIALKIGKDWETLATCIGIPSQEVYDLKEAYPDSPRNQRLTMMNRWEELYGSEATYFKMIQGLEQTGRRDLTEFLVNIFAQKDDGPTPMSVSRVNAAPTSGVSVGNSASGTLSNIHYSQSNKPGYLPLTRNSTGMFSLETPVNQLSMDAYGPQSEPVRKSVVDSPGKLFQNSLMRGTGDEFDVTRRVAVTPDSQRRISTGRVGHSTLKPFRNNYSGTQLTLLPSACGNPFSKASPTESPSSLNQYGPHPSSSPTSRNTDALIDTFGKIHIGNFTSLVKVPDDNMGRYNPEFGRRGRSSLPSRNGEASDKGGDKTVTTLQAEMNDTGDIGRTRSEPQCFKSREAHSLDLHSGKGEPVEDSLPQKPSNGLEKLADLKNSLSDSGIKFSTTAPTPSEPTIPLSNPQASPTGSQSENSNSDIIESQDTAVGANYLACGHLRRPSLNSSSSVDSNDSPFPSPEINPVQVSEKSPGEYHPLAGTKRSVRPRCRKCAKLKEESNTLREKVNQVQSEWDTERKQNTKQIRDLVEELHRQRQANYELTQCVYSRDLRHREASRTIQQLQMELQQMTHLFQLQEAEQARLKEAYDYCFRTKCELFKVRLQRADSMQCHETIQYENVADMSQHEQYPMHNTPNDYTNTYHEQITMNSSQDTQWQPDHNFQGQANNYNINPHNI